MVVSSISKETRPYGNSKPNGLTDFGRSGSGATFSFGFGPTRAAMPLRLTACIAFHSSAAIVKCIVQTLSVTKKSFVEVGAGSAAGRDSGDKQQQMQTITPVTNPRLVPLSRLCRRGAGGEGF